MKSRERKINRYAYATAVAETRILEKNMLTNVDIKRLLREKDPDSIYMELKNFGYFRQQQEWLTKSNYDKLLMQSYEDFIAEMNVPSPEDDFLDLIFLEYDIYNIKLIIMNQHDDLNDTCRPVKIPRGRLTRYTELSRGSWFFTPGRYDFLFEESARVYQLEGPKGLQEFLDRTYFSLILKISEKSGIPLFLRYSRSRIDFYNLLLLLRMENIARHDPQLTREIVAETVKEHLVAGGAIAPEEWMDFNKLSFSKRKVYINRTIYGDFLKEGFNIYGYDYDLSVLERCMDNYLMALCKEHQSIALGPEPIFGYLMGRKYEIMNIRLILTSLFLHVPEQIIEERLREAYV